MIDEILQVRRKRHIQDLNIVPILDMLTTVIFFLLLSTSFMEYTKLTLPPTATVSAPADSKSLPVAPKILVSPADIVGEYNFRLVWGGETPGQNTVKSNDNAAQIISQVKTLVGAFAQRFPKEKTLQVAMGKTVKYQVLISLMDGVKESLPDIVLSSYQEVDAP